MTRWAKFKQLAIPAIITAVVLLYPAPLQAQPRASRFIISMAAGPALFPMTAWRDFGEQYPYSRYENQELSLTGKVSIGLHINARGTLHLEIERLVSKATLFFYPLLENPGGPDIMLQINTTHWTYTGTPITLTYLHHLRNVASPWSPYLGLGLSYYFSSVEPEHELLYDPLLIGYPVAEETERSDSGYGSVFVLGMNVPMLGRLNLTPQLRYRWADASAFGDPNNVTISFTGYDFSIGLSWNP